MQTVTLEEAQAHLTEIIEKLSPGEEVLVTRAGEPVARIVAAAPGKPHPVPGCGKGMLTILAEDDEYLKDWAEYLP